MCDIHEKSSGGLGLQTVPVDEAVGMVLAHDITEIRKDEFKGAAFRKGHVIAPDDVPRLRSLGKENIFILDIPEGHMHEDEAAALLAGALMGEGLVAGGPPREGKINILAERDGLLRVDKDALVRFNMVGDVMCATLHTNTLVKQGQIVAGTRAIPLVVESAKVSDAIGALAPGQKALQVLPVRKPMAGIVITGNEVYEGRITDAFGPVMRRKVAAMDGTVVGLHYCPDDSSVITQRLAELLDAGADLLITTGGMSVDPDDVTRFAIRSLGAEGVTYGSPVLPGAMFMVAYVRSPLTHERVPVLGVPACGMYHDATVLDLVLPRVLAGQEIGRRELAELGHGGLCMNCKVCQYPVCPFGK